MSQAEIDAPVLDINPVLATLDQLNQLAENLDPQDRLRMYRAIGNIAGGLLEASEVVEVGFESTLEAHHNVMRQVIGPVVEIPSEVDHTEPLKLVAEHQTNLIDEASVLQPAEQEQNDANPEDAVDYSDLKLSPRQQIMFGRIRSSGGNIFKASDLYGGIEWTSDGARQQATSALLRKIKHSRHSSQLILTGTGAGSRYRWVEAASVMESGQVEGTDSANSETEFSGAAVNEDEIFSGQALLSTYGIELQTEGTLYASKDGIPLNLTPTSLKVLAQVAASNGATTFKDLINSIDFEKEGSNNPARDLNAALGQLGMEFHRLGMGWRDTTLSVDGRKVRKIEIVRPGQEPSGGAADFLVPQPR